MQEKGYTITRAGRALIAQSLATGVPVVWTGVIMGEESPPEGTNLADMEQLCAPVAAGTTTVPMYKDDRVYVEVEYRSDLNGGIGRGFTIREFGMYGKLGYIEDEEPTLIVYATEGDYGAPVGDFSKGHRDIRRWPITLVIGAGVSQDLGYSPQAFMTAQDIAEYTEWRIIPDLTAKLLPLIQAHNIDPDAHAGLARRIQTVESDIARLRLQVGTGITTNAFSVTFDSLDGLEVEGVWNRDRAQIAFGSVEVR